MCEIQSAVIDPSLENDLLVACRLRLPNESCGLLFGSSVNESVLIAGFAVMRNVSANPSHSFAFDPEEWISVFYEAQKNQRNVVGFFHSHPQGTAFPSVKDSQGWTSWGTYWIVSFAGDRQAQVAVYRKDHLHGWISIPLLRERLSDGLSKHTTRPT